MAKTKLDKIAASCIFGPATLQALFPMIPDGVREKCNAAELKELIGVLYAQKEYGYNECGKEFELW